MITIGKLVVAFKVVGAVAPPVTAQRKALPRGGAAAAAFADGILAQRAAFGGRLGALIQASGQFDFGPAHLEVPAEQNERRFERFAAGDASARAVPAGKVGPSLLQLSGAGGGPAPSELPGGGGRPLPEATRAQMESFLGGDFSGVRIHDDRPSQELAASIGARAFTSGPHVYFGTGEYNPSSASGLRLLAHELTHVQQQGGEGTIQRKAIAGVAAEALALSTMWRAGGAIGASVADTAGEPVQLSPAVQQGERPPTAQEEAREQHLMRRARRLGPGLPLERAERDRMERIQGRSLGNVRVFQTSAAQEASREMAAQGAQSGDAVVLSSQAAQRGQGGEQPTLQHEVTHAAQTAEGEPQRARRNPFARFMLEQAARLVERVSPEVAERFRLGEALRSNSAAERVSGWLDQALGNVLNPPAAGSGEGAGPTQDAPGATPGQNPGGDAAGQEGGGEGERPGETGKTAPARNPEEEESRGGDNYIQQIMREYGVRPHIGEEEFLEELTERVMGLMEEELLLETERTTVFAPPAF